MAGGSAGAGSVRVAELVATLSYAADLGLGQPLEHSMRQTVLALRLADVIGASDLDRAAIYYVGLLMNTYCHADAAEQAKWFGDDISFKGDSFELLDKGTAQIVAFIVRRVASHGSGTARARRLAAFPVTGLKEAMSFLATHSALSAQFAERIGLDESTCDAIRQAFEQWDGKGYPAHLKGADICLPARLVQLTGPVEVFSRQRGTASARAFVARHRGTQFDPMVADLFCEHAAELLDGLDEAAQWDAILDSEPALWRRVAGTDLDDVLEAMADLVDLKSPCLAGHSRGVADLASRAARSLGCSPADVTVLRRAGYLHDLGRLGISNSVWDKPGPLTDAERERVRLHPYLTDRMLARVDALRRSREVAARHHERLDGSGYPHGLTAASLTRLDRLLAAADACHAMTEPRPYRDPLGPDDVALALQREVQAGRLDGEAVNAVLKAAGARVPARHSRPGGLTPREVEVLELLARGNSSRQIARNLVIAPKTASNHVQNIYAKLGISSRAAATLYAMQHGLIGSTHR